MSIQFLTNSRLHRVEISWFLITQILRGINFGDSRSTKSAISTHSEAMKFDFNEFFALFEGWNLPNQQNSEPLK